ncbi:MAG TPA: EAL domain-containing protein [Acidimicrobiales bacterium]|nr:EAL domain-containing protein [Acidimicrobiales bacterium]
MATKSGSGLVRKFGVMSAVPIVLLGLILGQTQRTSIRARGLGDARQAASVVAHLGIQPQLSPSDLSQGLGPDGVARLDRLIAQSGVLGGEVARIKIWSRDLKVVYSDDHSSIGQTFPPSSELSDALDGHVASEISNLTKAENVGDRKYGSLLEVYVPMRFASDPQPAGAFEIYLPYRPIAAAIAGDTERVYGLLLGGLGLLYLVLFRIVAGASRRLRRQAADNEYLALHDPLTDLPNRTLFLDRVNQALLAGRRSGSGVTVITLDLDRFKEVNDTLGHHTGDLLLKELGERLRGVVREVDTVARLGGDEFAILVPSASDAIAAAEVAGRILGALTEPFSLMGLSVEVEASLGVAVSPDHGDEVGLLMQRADVAMYVAKANKTGFEVYASVIDSYSPERLVLLGELRRAIVNDELVLHYQPVVELGTGRVTGVEALVRWAHPTHGLLQPDEFIPMAETTELIGPLTAWVLDHALCQCRRWEQSGLDLQVAVNLSSRNLHHPEFPGEVAEALKRWDVSPDRLELEITESAVMTDPTRALKVLTGLRELGIALAIDDYGTGYSSLSYLSRLPVAKLKIDKSFILNMLDNEHDAVIVRSTIDLGRNLGLRVVAEGVETEETLRELTGLGCDIAQGYYLSRPVPADRLVGWLEARGEKVAAAAPA